MRDLMSEPKPIVKWAGGKRQLLNTLIGYSPKEFKEYYEPFFGGGALFFKLCTLGKLKSAHLNDSNRILIDAYRIVKENPDELIFELKKQKYENRKETFLQIRLEHPSNLVDATARLIYLNKTAFNGLYRVNSTGQFNVPFGRYKNPKILDEKNILAVSEALQIAELQHIDFEFAVNSAKEGDFIYFDPPYHPVSRTSNFTGYTKEDFSEKDQKRLATKFKELDDRGCFIMLSNSCTDAIFELYQEFNIHTVQATRMINCKAEGRGKIKELLITNYP
jgi:DNA adenine methylase